jgi:hypothetical protein
MNRIMSALLAVSLCVFPACSGNRVSKKTRVSARPAKPDPAVKAALIRKGRAKGELCQQLGPAFPRYKRVGCRGGGGVQWPAETPKKGGALLWPPVQGCLDRSIIRKVFVRQQPELACCVRPIRERNRIIIDVKIDCDGIVTEASVGSDFPLDALRETCLTTVLKTWRFVPPQGFVHVRYPINVVPAGQNNN